MNPDGFDPYVLPGRYSIPKNQRGEYLFFHMERMGSNHVYDLERRSPYDNCVLEEENPWFLSRSDTGFSLLLIIR